MKKLISVLALAMCITSTVSAADGNYFTSFDYGKRVLNISGNIAEGEKIVTVNIPMIGKTSTELMAADDAGKYIVYTNDTESNANGDFEFTIEFDENIPEGVYDIFIGSEIFDKAEHLSIAYLTKASYKTVIDDINAKANESYDAFKTTVLQAMDMLGFSNGIESLQSDDVSMKMFFEDVKANKLDPENNLENEGRYKAAVIARAMAKGEISSLKGYTRYALFADDKLAGYYDKCTASSEAENQFASIFNKNYTSLKGFENSVLDAVILTTVRYPGGVGNIMELFKNYKDYLGIEPEKATTVAYSSIAGKSYQTVKSCVDAFKNSMSGSNSSSQGSNGSSGGSGSSGGNKTNGSGIMSGPFISGADNVVPKEIEIKFVDLNSVPWAYKSISTLFSKGIINGKSETEFYPHDNVTREEFVKLLISLAGYENESYVNNFSDVSDNAWYAKYVNIAYKKGICKGIDENLFGVGMNITREDMCVMAYNLLVDKGVECKENDLSFDDADEFYDYSKATVGKLAGMGIVNGVGNNKFSPKGTATRAQAAVIIYNMLEYVK